MKGDSFEKKVNSKLRTSNDQVHRVITRRDAVGLENHFGLLMVHMCHIEDMVQKLVQLQAAAIKGMSMSDDSALHT